MLTRRHIIQVLPTTLTALRLGQTTPPASKGTGRPERSSEEAAQQARRLTDNLLKGIEERPREYVPEKLGVFWADIEAAVDRFGFQLWYCMKRNLSVWAAQFKDSAPVPINWSLPFEPSWLRNTKYLDRYLDSLFQLYGELAEQSSEAMGFLLRPLTPTEAKKNFSDGLVAFLTVRLTVVTSNLSITDRQAIESGGARLALSSPKAASVSPGVQFRVFTQHNGQRVRYTMSYFPDFSNPPVFGAPTSPVDGWIQPGLWKFGVDGPRSPLGFDPANFPVPPLKEAHLVV
jgi:hypothetical protein